MLTVNSLLEEVGLGLLAGRNAADAPIRWVHISELVDPTPWLSGGELLLTTGMGLTDEETQRAYVARLVQHSIGGRGFGAGVRHHPGPPPLLEGAGGPAFPPFPGSVA